MKKTILILLLLTVSLNAQSWLMLFGETANSETIYNLPTEIDSLKMWFDASEGVELANFQVMSWASKVSDDTLFSTYTDSTAMNLMWHYDDRFTNDYAKPYTGNPTIFGSANRLPILKAASSYTDGTIFVFFKDGSNAGYMLYNNGANYIRRDGVKAQSRNNNNFLTSTSLTTDSVYFLAVSQTGTTSNKMYLNGVPNGTDNSGSLAYGFTIKEVWKNMSYLSYLYEVLVYNRVLTDEEIYKLYTDYYLPKYINKTPTVPSETFEYLAEDSTNKGDFLGNVVLIGDLQYNELSTADWLADPSGSLTQVDSGFKFINYNSPFNGQPNDLLVLLGDVTDSTKSTEYDSIGVRLESLGIPYLSYPGNHDNYDTNFVNYLSFYNNYNTYNATADTMPDYLSITADADNSPEFWVKGVYVCPFDTNTVFLIHPIPSNPSVYPVFLRANYDYAWIDSLSNVHKDKNIILLTHEGFEAIKGGFDAQRNYMNVSGVLGSHWKDYGKLAFGMNGHHNRWIVAGNEYPTFSWTTDGFNAGTGYHPSTTYIEVYENKYFINNYSWDVHYNGGDQTAPAQDVEGEYSYDHTWFENGVWVKRNK